jgi:dipeptidyl-peptidase-4
VRRLFPVLSVLVLISASLAQSTPPDKLTLENIFRGAGPTGRAPESFAWAPNGKQLTFIQRDDNGERGTIFAVDLETATQSELISAEKLAQLSPPTSQLREERARDNRARYGVAAYHWSPDGQHILFDALGQLWYYSLASRTAIHLTSSTEPVSNPQFSPDGKSVAFVRNHNLFVHKMSDSFDRQLTKDGDDKILNGEVTWLYAEELEVRSNYFWSPDGRRILYLQSDQTNIPTYPLTDWMETHPPTEMMRYPKAGDPNPAVRLGVIDSNGGRTKWIQLTKDADVYIPRVGWVAPDIAYAMVLDRAQTQLDLYFIDVRSGNSIKMLTEKSEPFLELDDFFQILPGTARFVWPSWRDGHRHLYLYSYNQQQPLSRTAELVNQITRGEWEVTGVEYVDEPAKTLYFTGNKDDARREQLYRVSLEGGAITRVNKTEEMHAVKFAPSGRHYVDTHSSITAPTMVSLCTNDGTCRDLWRSRSVEDLNLAKPQWVDFTAEDGTVLHGVLLLPTSGPMEANGKFPIIMNPYGGPHGQEVVDKWNAISLFDQLLARRGFAILKVDNRGMGNRGKKFADAVYKNLGEIELKDQLAALKQVGEKFPQIDASRAGFWGGSYGGFMTLYAMTHSDAFAAGVSVSPVTDWRLYDSAYTERYMGMPQQNEDAYKKSAPLNSAQNLHGALLEVHGTGDDNVHMQNTIQMVQALITAGKQFRLMLYPRKTHALSGGDTKVHLYRMIQEHFESNLKPK